MNVIELTDLELKVLNDIVRTAKTTASAEELLNITRGVTASPILSLTYKTMGLWQTRLAQLQAEEEAMKATQLTEEPTTE